MSKEGDNGLNMPEKFGSSADVQTWAHIMDEERGQLGAAFRFVLNTAQEERARIDQTPEENKRLRGRDNTGG